MTLHYEEPHQRDIDWMVQLASRNVCEGVIEEPRVFWDEVTLLSKDIVTRGTPDVFVNGEQFPIRLTHASMALIPDFDANIGLDERFIQRVGIQLTFHDQYYMSRNFVPAPLWANKVVAAGDANTQGNASQIYERPNVLSARDSLRVMVQLNQVPTNGPRLVSAAVTGIGMLSKRPYFFADAVEIDDVAPTQLDTAQFRNDGTEPVALTDMSFSCGAEENDAIGQGDIRQLRVNVRQVGNGTQADWYEGPRIPSPLSRCPAQLLGYGTGRGIVHRFPGDGLIWEPGERVILDMRALDASVEGYTVGFSLYGYISVI
jgi:hypothetical protein